MFCLVLQLPFWMTPWNAAEGSDFPSRWPRTGSIEPLKGQGKPKWKWTFLSCWEIVNMKQPRLVCTSPGLGFACLLNWLVMLMLNLTEHIASWSSVPYKPLGLPFLKKILSMWASWLQYTGFSLRSLAQCEWMTLPLSLKWSSISSIFLYHCCPVEFAVGFNILGEPVVNVHSWHTLSSLLIPPKNVPTMRQLNKTGGALWLWAVLNF